MSQSAVRTDEFVSPVTVLPLAGRSLLVLEDEAIVSFLIEDMLTELGAANIWHAASVAKALAVLETHTPDVALLDVNLGREFAYPIAVDLDIRAIPFVFATGYGRSGLAPEWSTRAVLQKPFDTQMLGRALRSVMESRS